MMRDPSLVRQIRADRDAAAGGRWSRGRRADLVRRNGWPDFFV